MAGHKMLDKLSPCLIIMIQILGLCAAGVRAGVTHREGLANNADVKLFQKYLKINTTTRCDLTPAVKFWRRQAASAGVELLEYQYDPKFPVLVMKWAGADSSLSSVMLNSHMDVVPAEDDEWIYPPFSATLDEDGVIWGRGTQDMKSVSIQYFLAMKRLKEKNVTLLRDVYMTLMPDEEVGGENGMIPFLESEEFAAMNVGVELDEAAASPLNNIYALFYQDKAIWQIEVECKGEAAHSSSFPATNTTAVGKCWKVMNSLLEYRDQQRAIALASGSTLLNAGVYTAVNLNKMNAGTANNIIPDEASLVFDIRLATALNTTAFQEQLDSWLTEAGENVTLTFLQQDKQSARVVTNSSNPYYVALQTAAKQLNITMYPLVSPGATDGRYLRLKNIPAFGFSPMANTPTLLHTDNERVNATVFLQGIKYYETIIPALANLPASSTKNLDEASLVVQSPYN